MFAFLKRRAFLVALGVVLLLVFIWYADPLFKLREWFDLGGNAYVTQWIAIVLAAVSAAVWFAWKRMRAQRAGDRLAAAVVKQAGGDERPSAEVVQLRERFEEAVASLKQKGRGRQSLYDLPWYVIIGAPGSGKTTALVNSGLHFPLEQRSGKGALRGVGGTRNCDWWFTDEAVFLDTAGRYTTQDSDASADSASWAEFLALLKKYRKRRPVNGVLLALSAHDLMVQGQAGREAHVAAARRRLNELNKELRIQLPVYVLVTKCDLVAGFTEYFDDVAQEGRTQVWGVTFPQELTQTGGAAKAFPAEFDALIGRLNERVFARLEDDRDVRRRSKVFAFPQQMAALRETLSEFVSELFEATRFDERVRLRGVYFTSGTQEGTPIDRLLGAIGRRFAVPAEAIAPPGGRGKAYFIERLLKEVVLGESGLAGVNRRVELQKAAAQLGAYVGMALVAVLGVILFSVSYRQNVAYIDKVASDVARLRTTPAQAGAGLETVLTRLDLVHDVVESAARREDFVSWGLRWIYSGGALEDAARQGYSGELRNTLLAEMVRRFEQRLDSSFGQPVTQYRYLRGYLMLQQPAHFRSDYVRKLAAQEWKAAYAANPAAGESLALHFDRLLEYNPDGLGARQGNDALADRVRATLLSAPIAELIYGEIETQYDRPDGAQPLDMLTDQVFTRKSGRTATQPVSSVFTKDTFQQVVSAGVADLNRQFRDDYDWVWGEGRKLPSFPLDLKDQVIRIYEKAYIRTWDNVLADVGLVPLAGLEQTRRALSALGGKNSALRRLLVIVRTHTALVGSPELVKAAGGGTWIDSFSGWFRSMAGSVLPLRQQPGYEITHHFLPVHALLAGEEGKAPIDQLLEQIQEMEKKLVPLGGAVGDKPPGEGELGDIRRMSDALQREGGELPGAAKSVGEMVAEVGKSVSAATRSVAGQFLSDRYRREVADFCGQVVTGQYPFGSGADIKLADFGDLFGYGGRFDGFFTSSLEPYVDTTRRPWAWRPGAPTDVPLTVFERAHRIREAFFQRGSRAVQVAFNVTVTRLVGNSNRFQLEVDGKIVPYAYERERPWDVAWPGPKPGTATATFEERSGRRPFVAAPEGPWAWFRMLDMGSFQPQSDTQFTIALEKDGHRVEIRIDANSTNNPFRARGVLKDFRCGG